MNCNTRNLLLSLSVLIVALDGCSAVDKVVDNKINDMVAAENKRLPANVGRGINLIELEYHSKTNQLVMKYTVRNRNFYQSNQSQIKTEIRKHVKSNAALQRAQKNGVKVFHEFYAANESKGQTPGKSFARFESSQ